MQKKEFLENRQRVTYLDLFAGAGGFSEGFLQAFTENLYYDFKLASDINENCELTHRVRYNSGIGYEVSSTGYYGRYIHRKSSICCWKRAY